MFSLVYRPHSGQTHSPHRGSSNYLKLLPLPANNVAISTETTSNEFWPVDSGATTITGGTYSIDGAAHTADAGTRPADSSVELRGPSSDEYGTAVNVVLTIDGIDYTFVITTIAEPVTLMSEQDWDRSVDWDRSAQW